MDFQVEFTLNLDLFPDQVAVTELLRSHDFVTSDLGPGRLKVTGSFLQLRAVKVRLEPSVRSHTWPSRVGPAPRRATDAPPPGSVTPAAQPIVVDTDAFRYACRLRKTDVDAIMKSQKVAAQVSEVGGNTCISLAGRGAESRARHLQNLLSGLSRSLRTQEVPLREMGPEGIALLHRVQQQDLVLGSVLVRQVQDGLHLVGPSAQSYELQQRLLRRTSGQSGRRGRSSSLPPISRSHRDSGAFTDPPPPAAAAAPRRRSLSETRHRAKDAQTGRGNTTMTSLRQTLMNFSPASLRQRLRSLRRRR